MVNGEDVKRPTVLLDSRAAQYQYARQVIDSRSYSTFSQHRQLQTKPLMSNLNVYEQVLKTTLSFASLISQIHIGLRYQ